jgi:hypothetical protein
VLTFAANKTTFDPSRAAAGICRQGIVCVLKKLDEEP